MAMNDKLEKLYSSEFMNHAICVCCVPIAIMRLFVRLVAMFCSVGAVMLSDLIAVLTGRSYQQNMDLSYLPAESFVAAEENGLPYWYLRLTLYSFDDITQFHEWLVSQVSNVEFGNEEDDDDDLRTLKDIKTATHS